MYRNILDYFEECCAVNKNKVALFHHDQQITFAKLQSDSLFIAGYLRKHLPDAVNRPIAVLLPKSIAVYACDIGILYSSNFFSNLDIKTPSERIGAILEQMKPAAVLTNKKYHSVLNDINNLSVSVFEIDDFDWSTDYGNHELLKKQLEERIDTDPMCIINTSGSTGTPKGVVLNHKSFFDFVAWSLDTFHFDGSEVIGALSPVVFDIYDYELCLMMVKGSSIVLLDAELATFPVKLLMEVKEKRVSFIFWVPTIMVNIANLGLLDKITLSDLKTVWFAGEVFPTKQFNIWKRHLPDTVFANLYGPIEITLDCLFYIIDSEYSDDQPLPIGIPCHNTDILLLNENNQKCKQGEEGEICVRGTSLAMGYYNNPEKTAAAFVQNPLNHSYPELIYRTGDIGYINEDGLMMFKGRKDSLIKHMGYRIELGEIEHITVNSLKLVPNCCVVYNHKKRAITMYYESAQNISDLEIKKALGKVLPRYMVPTDYIMLETLPRNTNGKIDRLKLSNAVNNNK